VLSLLFPAFCTITNFYLATGYGYKRVVQVDLFSCNQASNQSGRFTFLQFFVKLSADAFDLFFISQLSKKSVGLIGLKMK
jgi:hypothetical protein